MARLDISKILKDGYKQFSNSQYLVSYSQAKKVLEKKYNIDAYMLAGMSLYQLKNFDEADEYLEVAFKENKNDIGIQLFYFENLKQLKEFTRAVKKLDELKISDEKMIFLAASIYEIDGNFLQVVKLLRKAKSGLKAHEILAWNYENLNKTSEAKEEVVKGLIYKQDSFKLNIVLSKLCIRNKHYKKAQEVLKKINKKELSKANKSIYYSIQARCFEGLKKYKKAFASYKKSNNCLKETDTYKELQGSSYYTFKTINVIKAYFEKVPDLINLIDSKEKITFMVGYPRSGTTLLENILNAHSEVLTIEEKPLVDDILHYFLENPQSINKLETITDFEICELQNKYIEKRKEFSVSSINGSSKIIIDKLPLNIIHIGILYRIFPNAKFIISTRDVRDVALSCYFQNFAINDAMSYFLDWNITKKYLYESMSLGMEICQNYPVMQKIIKYENLVDNTKNEIKKLVAFLGLQWQESIMDYRDNIVGRNINTPSYESISKKITTKRIKRWKNYKKHFE